MGTDKIIDVEIGGESETILRTASSRIWNRSLRGIESRVVPEQYNRKLLFTFQTVLDSSFKETTGKLQLGLQAWDLAEFQRNPGLFGCPYPGRAVFQGISKQLGGDFDFRNPTASYTRNRLLNRPPNQCFLYQTELRINAAGLWAFQHLPDTSDKTVSLFRMVETDHEGKIFAYGLAPLLIENKNGNEEVTEGRDWWGTMDLPEQSFPLKQNPQVTFNKEQIKEIEKVFGRGIAI